MTLPVSRKEAALSSTDFDKEVENRGGDRIQLYCPECKLYLTVVGYPLQKTQLQAMEDFAYHIRRCWP